MVSESAFQEFIPSSASSSSPSPSLSIHPATPTVRPPVRPSARSSALPLAPRSARVRKVRDTFIQPLLPPTVARNAGHFFNLVQMAGGVSGSLAGSATKETGAEDLKQCFGYPGPTIGPSAGVLAPTTSARAFLHRGQLRVGKTRYMVCLVISSVPSIYLPVSLIGWRLCGGGAVMEGVCLISPKGIQQSIITVHKRTGKFVLVSYSEGV